MSADRKVILAKDVKCALQLIDWNLCFICEKSSTDPLLCPANSTRLDRGSGYKTFLENIIEFRKFGEVPFNADRRLEKASINSVDDLLNLKAKWHKSCNLLFSQKNILRKRKSWDKNQLDSIPEKKSFKLEISTRSTSHVNEDACLFCDQIKDLSLKQRGSITCD